MRDAARTKLQLVSSQPRPHLGVKLVTSTRVPGLQWATGVACWDPGARACWFVARIIRRRASAARDMGTLGAVTLRSAKHIGAFLFNDASSPCNDITA